MASSTTTTCPYLPDPVAAMSHRYLTDLDKDTPEFYFKALQYGNYLWANGHAGRAILAITRALYADIQQDDTILDEWPLPYAALKWIVEHHQSDDFPGNPRISFQHQATRLRGERQELRRARAWAVWALIRHARPSLQGDLNDPIEEPSFKAIEARLNTLGHPGEAQLWAAAMSR